MKFLHLFFTSLIAISFSCKEQENSHSKSYNDISKFLTESGISNPEVIYFYEGKPRMPLPNVYCFDSNGVQLNVPPQCFNYLDAYIGFLEDSIMPVKNNGQSLERFLDSIHIMDAYDQRVEPKQLGKHDYFLFVDFLSIGVKSFQEVLANAVNRSKTSKRKIRLFLVHAISEKNINIIKETGLGDKSTVQDSTAGGDTLRLSF